MKSLPTIESLQKPSVTLSRCLSRSKLFSSYVKNLGGSQVCPAGPSHLIPTVASGIPGMLNFAKGRPGSFLH